MLWVQNAIGSDHCYFLWNFRFILCKVMVMKLDIYQMKMICLTMGKTEIK